MERIKVKIINDSSNPLPAYETPLHPPEWMYAPGSIHR